MLNRTMIAIYVNLNGVPNSVKYDWLQQSNNGMDISIPAYLDVNAFDIRKQYLAFVYDLAQEKIGNKTLAAYFTTHNGYDLWNMGLIAEKNLVKSSNISNCLKLLALERLLTRDAVKEIKLVCTDRVIGTAIEQLCHNMQIRIEWPGKKELTNRVLYIQRFSLLMRSIGLLLLIFREGFLFRKMKAPKWFTGDQSLFIFSYFFNIDKQRSSEQSIYSRYWEILPTYLRKCNIKINWLNFFISDKNFPDPTSAIAFANKINKSSASEHHAFLAREIGITQLFRCFLRYMYYWFNGWTFKGPNLLKPKQSAASFRTLLFEDWSRSTYGPVLMQNILWATMFDKAFKTLPKQKTGLYLQENTAWEPAFVHAWRKYGHGTLIGVAHATIRFWDLRYFRDSRDFAYSAADNVSGYYQRPDYTAVNGPLAFSILEKAGHPTAEIVPVEALRYIQGVSENNIEAGSEKKVLICGDIDPASTTSMLHCLERAVSLLSDEAHMNLRFIFKPHPACMIPVDIFQIPCCEMFTGSMQEAIGQSRVLIAPDSTTAAVEGFEKGLSVILFNFADRVNFSPLLGVSGVSFVSTHQEMAELINNTDFMHKREKEFFFWKDESLSKWSDLLTRTGYKI